MSTSETIHDHPFFSDLSASTREQIEAIVVRRSFAPGDVIVRENDRDRDIYLIVTGSVEIVSASEAAGREFRLGVLEAGEIVGQLAILDGQPRSASVKALEPTETLVVPAAELQALSAGRESPWLEVASLMVKRLGARFRDTSNSTIQAFERELQLQHERVETASFITFALLLISLGTVVTKVASLLGASGTGLAVLGFSVVGVIAVGELVMMVSSGRPMAHYGITFAGWKEALFESLPWTIPVLALVTLAKWGLVELVPRFHGQAVFEPPETFSTARLIHLAVYCILAILQELVTRSGLQAPLEHFLTGPRAGIKAILISNFVFAVFHLLNGFFFALAVFVPGLFWGLLFTRHRSLVGVSVSHIIIGCWALFFLGIGPILNGLP